jgi:hypothetical protein
MTPLLWIALGFVALLVVFLMITYLKRDTSSANQHNTLRFLTALCSGFAGAFFTGDALFRLDQQLTSGAKIGVSGTAGFALFFVVWFTYGKWSPSALPSPPDRFRLSIPEGWTFEQSVRVVAQTARGNVEFHGFQKEQLSVKMRATDLDGSDAQDALTKLWYAAYDGLPKYRVDLDRGVYHIRMLESSYASE